MITLDILEQRLLQFPYFDTCLVCFFFRSSPNRFIIFILTRSVLKRYSYKILIQYNMKNKKKKTKKKQKEHCRKA